MFSVPQRIACSLMCLIGLLATRPESDAQSAPAGISGDRLHLSMGAGASSFNMDWGHERMMGSTLWADYEPRRVPSVLRGLGVEAEARDINYDRSSSLKYFRLYTFGGGVIYRLEQFRLIRPYGKYLLDFGNIDWDNPNPHFRHETRTVQAPGFGIECRIVPRIWLRADYEYQFWPEIAKFRPHSTHVLDPQGLTFGVSYQLAREQKHTILSRN